MLKETQERGPEWVAMGVEGSEDTQILLIPAICVGDQGLCPERAKLSAHLTQVGATEGTNQNSPTALVSMPVSTASYRGDPLPGVEDFA